MRDRGGGSLFDPARGVWVGDAGGTVGGSARAASFGEVPRKGQPLDSGPRPGNVKADLSNKHGPAQAEVTGLEPRAPLTSAGLT